ncbi:LysR family transcriptional regulator [Megasphaera sp. AM44-1BH]|uniref:LysR family transcriptional regulator n=1 Tax=Megasphaera sp. AM44-1BH TaxID=2292358 RepID=UPI0013140D5A|nr:LysR family transcriptional regulator [Megasphaera sp. AM44-1BH]
MYTNEDLQIFVDLSQTLSFSQTARNLHLSQSTVSKRIKDLETALQVVLIERGQGMKSLRLTLAGENFLTIANEMLSLWKDACHLGRGRWQSSFTIASLSSLNIQAIPSISDYLHEHIPTTHLHVMTSHSGLIYDLVERHQADLGFSLIAREYQNTLVEKWFSEPMVVVRPAGTEIFSPVCSPRDLPQEMEIYNYSGISFQAWHDEWWAPVNNSYISLDNASLIPLVLNKPGQWSVVQISMAKKLAATGRYIIQKLTDPPPDRVYYLVTHLHPTQTAARILSALRPCLQSFAGQEESAGKVIHEG